ncbi:DinB family protein [Pedobacter kyonggii]|uniref:DinB family protein n=1 Tax=Pedobacter kyonggii TaxID=1926871 RepID=A0A4Q9HHU2_9SPHI|nr:DinB family protein [Pedobacter kyonggii]TBO44923.1 DinB family protein [Pedobacter kyonggii]
MLTETLKTLFNRDLNKLKSEIGSYKNEANLWVINKEIANSAGNLCLHLIGNLNTYIGATLGGSNYIRKRELEFSLKDIPKQELINMIEATITVVNETLGKITDEQLNSEYPMLVFQEKTSTEFFLVHLTTHLAYHLGQINYHRRLLDA